MEPDSWDYGSAACIFNAFPGEFIHTEIRELLVFGQWANLKWICYLSMKCLLDSPQVESGLGWKASGFEMWWVEEYKGGEGVGALNQMWWGRLCWVEMRRREKRRGLGGFLRGGTSMSKAWRWRNQSDGNGQGYCWIHVQGSTQESQVIRAWTPYWGSDSCPEDNAEEAARGGHLCPVALCRASLLLCAEDIPGGCGARQRWGRKREVGKNLDALIKSWNTSSMFLHQSVSPGFRFLCGFFSPSPPPLWTC